MASLRGAIVLLVAVAVTVCQQEELEKCASLRESCSHNVGGCWPDQYLESRCEAFGVALSVCCRIPDCGVKSSAKIVGGSNDGSCEPWLASVQFKQNRNGAVTFVTCSAVLVSKTALLSAASCFDWTIHGAAPQVVIGDNATFVTESHELVLPVSEIIKHPDYDIRTKENNIAILKLERPVFQPLPCVYPICLPQTRNNLIDCKIGGYGKRLESDSDVSNMLQIGDVHILPDYVCPEKPSNTLCATSYTVDACRGDDGGMLACRDEYNKWQLVGLIGDHNYYGCTNRNRPSYYTDIIAYGDWITTHI